MPKWAKILLIILGCIVVLGIGAVIAGVVLFNYYGRPYLEAGMEKMKEGQEYGRKTENTGCVTEAVNRYKGNKGINGAIQSKLFLNGCLMTSKATPGFCDDVPGPLQFTESTKWLTEQCRAVGLENDQNCPQIFQSVQQHCEKGGSTSSDK